MKLPLVVAAFLLLPLSHSLTAQDATRSPAAKDQAKPKERAEKQDPLQKAFGGKLNAKTDQPITTEIFADEVFFDAANYVGTFTGRVIVHDPRFNLQADKLTVYMAKGDEQGLQRVVAEGNVGVVREAPEAEGGRTVARAEKAVYTAADGNVELTGSPRVQAGVNSHIATSPDTVMLLNEAGILRTKGPSRTELRQGPAPAEAPKP